MITHPHPDEHGRPVVIHEPHTPSHPDTWNDPTKVATFTPLSKAPSELNGVPVYPDERDSLHHSDFKEPAFHNHNLSPAAGVIMHENGRVWVVSPTNAFGGYHNTFPKGRHEGGELKHTAVRETHEESGLRAKITGVLGDYSRSTTRTRYYIAERVGGHPAHMGWESQATHLVPIDQLHEFVNNPVDQQIARDFQQHMRDNQKVRATSGVRAIFDKVRGK